MDRLLIIVAVFLAPRITRKQLNKLPSDLYEVLQKQMKPKTQMKLFNECKQWYGNGTLKSHWTDRTATQWFTNGIPMLYEEHIQNMKHGKTLRWYQNGQLWIKEYFKLGQRHGSQESWGPDGKKWVTKNFHGLDVLYSRLNIHSCFYIHDEFHVLLKYI